MNIQQLLDPFSPGICSFSYIQGADNPVVCQMGFILYGQDIVLHTSTWMHKWKTLEDHQKVALAIGLNHLSNYCQVFGRVHKVGNENARFHLLEAAYLKEHPDARYYQKGQEGILLVQVHTIRMAIVDNRVTSFEEYVFNNPDSAASLY